MDFGRALQFLRNGGKMQRSGWNGKDMWIHMQTPDEHSKMSLPYLYMKTSEESSFRGWPRKQISLQKIGRSI